MLYIYIYSKFVNIQIHTCIYIFLIIVKPPLLCKLNYICKLLSMALGT